jgi:putative addiction module component (TIGR02574 family)
MSSLNEELVQRARALPPEDRARLAEELLASLSEDGDSELEAAWDEEIRQRIAEIESGTARLIPAEEVFAEIRQMLRPSLVAF